MKYVPVSIALLSACLVVALCIHAHAQPLTQTEQGDAFFAHGVAAEQRGDLVAAENCYELTLRVIPNHRAAQAKLADLKKTAQLRPIPRIEFREATVREALDYIRFKARVNIVLNTPSGVEASRRVTLSLTNVPTAEAIRYVAWLSDLNVVFEEDTFRILAQAEAKTSAPLKAGNKALEKEAADIIIPQVNLEDITIRGAVAYLRRKSIDPAWEPVYSSLKEKSDYPETTKAVPRNRGINIVLKPDSTADNTRITLQLRNVSLTEAVRHVATMARMQFSYEDYAIAIFKDMTDSILASASHLSNPNPDAGGEANLNALSDGREASSSYDNAVPHFTWLPRRGTLEWVQYDFAEQYIERCSVYWYQNNAEGVALPQSWKVLYREPNGLWIPVDSQPSDPYANGWNMCRFPAIKTTGLRLVVQLRDASAGIQEWKIMKSPVQKLPAWPRPEEIRLDEVIPTAAKVGWGEYMTNRGEPVEIDGKPAPHYIFPHANSAVSFVVPSGYTRFSAIGIGPVRPEGQERSWTYEVQADGKAIYQSPRLDTVPGKKLAIDLNLPAGTRLITLITDNAGNPNGDHSVWADPKLLMPRVSAETQSKLAKLEANLKVAYLAAEQFATQRKPALRAEYLASVQRAFETTQRFGDKTQAAAIQEEARLLNNNAPIPDTDAAGTPAVVTGLRATYRSAVQTATTARLSQLKAAYEQYDRSLEALAESLGSRPDDREAVKRARLRAVGLREMSPFPEYFFATLMKPATQALAPTVPDLKPIDGRFGGHRYRMLPDKISWPEAKDLAASLGGHLATITTKEENDWIRETFIKKLPNSLGVWLGGTSEGTRGVWRWSTGEPFQFADWAEGEPSNVSGEPVFMFGNRGNGQFGWFDISPGGRGFSDWRGGLIVEWESEAPPAAPLVAQPAVASPVPNPSPLLAVSKSVLESGKIDQIVEIKLGAESLKFCYCPAGDFAMGSPADEEDRTDAEGQAPVKITKSFWMGQTEMTQEFWETLTGTNPSLFKSRGFPVEYISWEEAAAAVRKLNDTIKLPDGWAFALPTEAQWEYACRAGTTTPFSFGKKLDGKEANVNGSFPYGSKAKGPYVQKTTRARTYPPNKWGLYDMHGNVYEWCLDWYGSKLTGGADPLGPNSGDKRMLKGGCYNDGAALARSADRSMAQEPGKPCAGAGIRIALVPAR